MVTLKEALEGLGTKNEATEWLRSVRADTIKECTLAVQSYDYDELFGQHPKDILAILASVLRALEEPE